MIAKILKFEGLVVFLACLYFYNILGASWLIFVLPWLVPDISMVGYLINQKLGAIIYNFLHTYILAMVIGGKLFTSVLLLTSRYIFELAVQRFCMTNRALLPKLS